MGCGQHLSLGVDGDQVVSPFAAGVVVAVYKDLGKIADLFSGAADPDPVCCWQPGPAAADLPGSFSGWLAGLSCWVWGVFQVQNNAVDRRGLSPGGYLDLNAVGVLFSGQERLSVDFQPLQRSQVGAGEGQPGAGRWQIDQQRWRGAGGIADPIGGGNVAQPSAR